MPTSFFSLKRNPKNTLIYRLVPAYNTSRLPASTAVSVLYGLHRQGGRLRTQGYYYRQPNSAFSSRMGWLLQDCNLPLPRILNRNGQPLTPDCVNWAICNQPGHWEHT